MIVVDLPMPKSCMSCVFRMTCLLYLDWLSDPKLTATKLKNFPKSEKCLIKEEVKDGS